MPTVCDTPAALLDAVGKPLGSSDWLAIDQNSITDLSPLSGLTQLTTLTVRDNIVLSDLTPVASLTNLTQFFFSNNDIGSIAALTNMMQLPFSEQSAGSQKPLLQEPLVQSLPVPQPWPPTQGPQLAPPQSTSVSSPFCTPSLQVAA